MHIYSTLDSATADELQIFVLYFFAPPHEEDRKHCGSCSCQVKKGRKKRLPLSGPAARATETKKTSFGKGVLNTRSFSSIWQAGCSPSHLAVEHIKHGRSRRPLDANSLQKCFSTLKKTCHYGVSSGYFLKVCCISLRSMNIIQLERMHTAFF